MIFIELFAGLAAVSLRLNEPKRRPLVPRMGNKGSYADAILDVFGTVPGGGATRYLWAEPDRLCRTILRGCGDAALMRRTAEEWRQIADRCQRDRDSWRAVWESHRDPDRLLDALIMSRLSVPQTAFYNTIFNGDFMHLFRVCSKDSESPHQPSHVNKWLDSAKPIIGELYADAWDIAPIPGAVCYLDPPYDKTKEYGYRSTRGSVVDLALRWADVADMVAISEHTPITMLGWDAVDITSKRIGPGRNTTRSSAEWLTVFRRDRHRKRLRGQLSLAL